MSQYSSFNIIDENAANKNSHQNSDLTLVSLSVSENSFKALFNKTINIFKTIIRSLFVIDFSQKGNIQSGFNCMLIIGLVTIFSTPLTLIPQHDVLLYPKYWPEGIFAPLAISAFLACNFVFDSILLLNTENVSPFKMLATLFLWNTVPRMVLRLVINVLWIYGVHKHPPVPYIGYATHTVGMITISTGFWLLHSKAERRDTIFRNRFKWYLCMRLVRILINTGYNFVAKMFEKFPSRFQVGFALVLPMMRYLNSVIQHKMANKARGANESSAKLSVSSNVACSHALQLAIVIGSSATNFTSYVICGIDIILNLVSCLKIVILHKRNGENACFMIKDRLQALVIKETLELMLPISYCLILTISYFGPNAEIMGNIKNDYWQYKKINDIIIPLKKIGLFLVADLVRVILSTLVLKISCNINFLSEYSRLMAVYWKPITTTIAAYIIGVSF